MSDLRAAAQQALEALEWAADLRNCPSAIAALKFALAQPEQEPVAWMFTENEKYGNAVVLKKHKPKTYDSNWWSMTPLYTAPPQRKPLTDEEIDRITDAQWASNNHKPVYAAHRAYARAIEAAHGIKE